MQTAIMHRLTVEYEQRRLKNSSYSLRAFAKYLDISSGALSAIMLGKRRISKRSALRLSHRLRLDPEQCQQFLNAFESKSHTQIDYQQISPDSFKLIAEWYHLAILSLINTDDFSADSTWVANRLGIAKKTVEKALERLEKLGLIEKGPNTFKRCAKAISIGDEGRSLAIQKAHIVALEMAKHSLEFDPEPRRDFSSVTLAIDASRLDEACQRIRQFEDDMSAFLETGLRSEVYKLSIQLYPLTKHSNH